MLKSQRMKKVSVLASKSDMKKVIDNLYEKGACHIVHHKADELDIGEPLAEAEDIDEALVSARSLKSEWNIDLKPKNSPTTKQAIRKITSISKKHRKHYDQKKEAEEELSELNAVLEAAEVLKKLNIDPEYLDGLESVKGFVGTMGKNKDVEKAVSGVTSSYEIERNGEYVAVFTEREKAEEVRKALQATGFNELDAEGPEEADKVRKRIKKLEKEISRIEKEDKKLAEKSAQEVTDSENVLSQASEKAEAPLKFAVSDNVFYIEGYVPTDEFDGLEEELKKKTRNRIDFKEIPADREEDIPVEMEHTKPVEPFEFFMDLYALPKYSEFDPTALTFITFPLLFGFMLGDMGYGVVTLIAFLIMRKLVPSMKRLLSILVAASIWTIIFGLMFGEVFGEEVLFGFHFPHILSRLHDINDLLLLSIAVGVVHVNIGLAVGFYNEYKAHGFMEALYEKGGWVVLEIAALLLGLNFMNGLSIYYGLGVLAVAIGMIYRGEGIKGLIELPAIFSNILSYARLMAIGLASAGLAVVVNQFAKDFFAQGISGILPGVLILVIGHFINILLGMLGPFLHSLRLHYVEFFTKFFKGGGKPFEPFGGR